LRAAKAAKFVGARGALDIENGCRDFFDAYSTAVAQQHTFRFGAVHRELMGSLTGLPQVDYVADGRSWRMECGVVDRESERLHEDLAGPR
jgi:hypothetical protein